MSLHLAVDAGGTSTRGVLVDTAGDCLGYGRGGSGNPISAGPELAAASVVASARAALRQAGAEGARVASVLLAMAGASSLNTAETFAAPLREIGVDAPISFTGDLHATFCSGSWRAAGYALVAGTGAAAIRVEGGRVAATADGLGWLLGDDGSGYWIGHRVARAVVAALDRRGPATELTPLLLHALGLADDGTPEHGRPAVLQRLIEALYALRPVQLSQFARLAFDASGDAVADAIAREAADALLHTLDAVASPSVHGPVVLGGGTLSQHGELARRVAAAHARAGETSEVVTVEDGTIGAAVIALREAGATVDAAVFAALRSSLAALR